MMSAWQFHTNLTGCLGQVYHKTKCKTANTVLGIWAVQAEPGPSAVPESQGDESSPGSIQGVQAGAGGDRARDRVGGNAAACVQSPPREQVWR